MLAFNLLFHFITLYSFHRYQTTNDPYKPKRTNHFRSITPTEQQRILDFIRQNPTASSEYIKDTLNLNCTARTIRGFLIKSKLRSRVQVQQDALTERHLNLRLEFCNTWMEDIAFNAKLMRVVFSDEKTFCISKSSKGRVRRPPLTRFVYFNYYFILINKKKTLYKK